ncbi:MAG: FtsW/RodA/SpoVE family cell cycle protein, partial [Victivallales bacterium]|nr:FtsW/RodA/SpoVE family cell cycle protein [Victivallales bacterium]
FIALLFALLFLVICLFTAGITWLRSDAGTPYVERITTSPALNSIGLRDYHIKRIHNYLTPRGEWNERQSIVTIASGGSYGKGYLQGTMKNLGFLPRTVAPTDFIFAVICEEMGFLFGCLPVVGLYALLLAITLHWSACAEDKTGSALCNGLSMLLFTHIAINLAMTTRLIPIMGLPLPLLSYGGSYLLATLLALGTMASIPLHTGNREAPSTSGENTISIFNFIVIRLR